MEGGGGGTLERTGSSAMSRMRGGASRGIPLGSRVRAEARSNLNPSTWYSSTHLNQEPAIHFEKEEVGGSQYGAALWRYLNLQLKNTDLNTRFVPIAWICKETFGKLFEE
jgi:hypothetical protein